MLGRRKGRRDSSDDGLSTSGGSERWGWRPDWGSDSWGWRSDRSGATAPSPLDPTGREEGATTGNGTSSDTPWTRAARPSKPRDASMPGDDDGTVHGVGGYIPLGVSARRATRDARRVEVDHRRQLLEIRKADLRAGRDEARNAGYLPRHGQPGPMAGRSYRRLRVTPHRATSEVLAGAYPFLAEEGLGAEGALVGQDAWSGTAFCFDPWELYRRGALTNPNMFLAGQIGRGKSTLAKALATRYIAFGRRVYVPGDPKGEWTVVTRAVGGQVIELGVGQRARLNPLDDGPRPSGLTDEAWRSQVVQRRMSLLAALAESTLGRPLGPVERTALDAALATAVKGASTPILPMVVDALHAPGSAYAGSTVEQLVTDGRQVAHALGRLVRGDLAGLFDGPSTVRLDPSLPMLSLDLSHISGSDTLIGLVMTCTASWLEAALADPAGGQRLVVYDEAWRLLAQPSLLARMQAQWKLSRAWGLANLMVVHRLSDLEAAGDAGSETRGLAQGLLGDTATRILYNEPTDEAIAAGKVLGLSSTETDQLPDLAQGEGLWRVNERAFVIRHICTPAELALFDTNTRMVEKADRVLRSDDR
jgi:hypothetical protein